MRAPEICNDDQLQKVSVSHSATQDGVAFDEGFKMCIPVFHIHVDSGRIVHVTRTVFIIVPCLVHIVPRTLHAFY